MEEQKEILKIEDFFEKHKVDIIKDLTKKFNKSSVIEDHALKDLIYYHLKKEYDSDILNMVYYGFVVKVQSILNDKNIIKYKYTGKDNTKDIFHEKGDLFKRYESVND